MGHYLLIYSHRTSVRYFLHDLASVSFAFLFGFASVFLMTFSQHPGSTEPLRRSVLVVSCARVLVFLKESIGFSQVNFNMWLIGFLMHLHKIPPGRLTAAQLLGVPDYSSELVFLF